MYPVALIETDNRLLDADEEVGIPEALRFKAQRYIRHCVRIVIEARGTNGKYAKANGFKLTKNKDSGDGYPVEELDNIVQTIMCCVNHKFAERMAADENTETIDFRVVFDQRNEGNRSRPAVDLEDYSPDGPDMPFSMIGGGDHEDTRDTVIENLMNLIDKLALRLDDAHVHLISMSDRSKDIFEPLTKLMAMSHSNQVTGMEMQRRAMEYMYSIKRIEEEEAGKDRRTEKWMDWLKKPADSAVRQFGKYMRIKARKLGIDDDDDDDDDDDKKKKADDKKKKTDKPKPSSSTSTKPPRPGADGPTEKPDADTIENPVANMARSLGQIINPKQWAEAAEILTKKQLKLFAELLESETDAQAIERYDKIAEGGIPLTKLVMLQSVLDERQSEGLNHLRTFIAKAKEGWGDGEGEPN